MIKSTFKIPIYPGRLVVIFADDLAEVEKDLGLNFQVNGSDLQEMDAGCFDSDSRYYLMFEGNPSAGIIAHEAKHMVNKLFYQCGVYLDAQNDEPECYLLGWVVDKVHKVFEEKKLD